MVTINPLLHVDNLRTGQELLLLTVKCHKLSLFGHVCRPDALSKIIHGEHWIVARFTFAQYLNVGQIGMDVPVKFGDSGSHRFRDM